MGSQTRFSAADPRVEDLCLWPSLCARDGRFPFLSASATRPNHKPQTFPKPGRYFKVIVPISRRADRPTAMARIISDRLGTVLGHRAS